MNGWTSNKVSGSNHHKHNIMKKLILVTGLLLALTTTASAQGGEAEPPYGMGHLEAYSLFYENYRTGDYEMALTFGEWMLEAKPREIQGHSSFSLDRQFERLIDIYAGLAEQESDPTVRREYYQKALGVYDLAMETFTEEEIDEFRWINRKGRFYQENRDYIENAMDQAYEQYQKAYALDPEQFVETADGYYARILLDHVASNGERDEALAMIEQMEPLASASLQEAIDEARNGLFSDPSERVVFLEEQLAGSENPEEILEELAGLYEELDDQEKATETATRLYDLNPDFDHTMAMADLALANAQNSEALRYLNEAEEKAASDAHRVNVLLQIADVQQQQGDLQQARQTTRRALQLDGNSGDAYMRLASIYAAAVNRCTSDRSMERRDRTVYWLVLDYLDRARDASPSLSSTVNRQYASYEAVQPSTEDKFFNGWEAGDSFQIDDSVDACYGWINESTTVR